MSLLLIAISVLGLMSGLAFWRSNVILFMLVAGMALMTGLYCPNAWATTTELGLTMGLMLIAYSFFSIAMAFRLIFWRGEHGV